MSLYVLAKNSDILKDTAMPEGSRRFSLARVQIALWFFVIASSYVLIWVMTGEMPKLKSDILILMGISSLTYFMATTFRREDIRNLKDRANHDDDNPAKAHALRARYTERLNTRIFPEITRCLLYTSPSPRDRTRSRMPSSA